MTLTPVLAWWHRRRGAGEGLDQRTGQSERLLQSAMDALPTRVALLDERGFVLAAHGPRHAWAGGLPDPRASVGMDYPARCDRVSGPAAPAAQRLAAAIRGMLSGAQTDVRLEHVGHAGESGWFQLRLAAFREGGALRVVLAHDDVSHLKAAEAALRELTGRLLHLQDEERRRIARELHDGAGQNLVALTMSLARLKRLARADARMEGIVAEGLALVEQTLQEMRSLSCVLHPPALDGTGLVSAVRAYVAGFTGRSGIEVQLDLPPDCERLPAIVESALFRVIQESLVDIYRYSGSGTAAVRLQRGPGAVRLEVTDEGMGAGPVLHDPGEGAAGSGLQALRERLRQLGGQLEIRTDTHGTTVTAVAPLMVEGHATHPAR